MTNTGEPYLPIRIDITPGHLVLLSSGLTHTASSPLTALFTSPGELESLIKLHQQALQEPVNRDAVEVFRWFCRSKDEVFAFISGRPEQKSQGPMCVIHTTNDQSQTHPLCSLGAHVRHTYHQ